MSDAIKWAVILAVVVTAMQAVVILSGVHKSPIAGSLIPIGLAIAINLIIVFLALRGAATSTGYMGQLRKGLAIGVVGGALIAAGAWVLLVLVFPNAIDEMRGAVGLVRTAGLPEKQIQAQREAMDAFAPANQAIRGLLGTMFTSIFGAAIIGAFVRKR